MLSLRWGNFCEREFEEEELTKKFPARGASTKPPKKNLILIVDDDPAMRVVLKSIADAKGFATLEAANGQEAIALALSEKPSLVLLDLQMPVLNGLEAVRQMKQDPESKDIPVIAITGVEAPDAALAAGCCECLSKPLDIEMLKKLLDWFSLGLRP